MDRYVATVAEREHEVSLEPLDGDRFTLRVVGPDGVPRERMLEARQLREGSWVIVMDGQVSTVDVSGTAPQLGVDLGPGAIPVTIMDARRKALEAGRAAAEHKRAAGPAPVRAPMPGKVIKILVQQGEPVAAQQPVAIVEAMKMENELRSPRAGTIRSIRVTEGQAVEAGETLLELGE